MGTDMPWRVAVEKVLREAPGALHYQAIADKIIADGLRTQVGATPAMTVSRELTQALKTKGDRCPFTHSNGRGMYVWRRTDANSTQAPLPAVVNEPVEEDEDKEVQCEVISSFGMFWRRDAIDWVSTPRILGMQQIGADSVDFHKQIGLYLLYDGREVIYVGRATDRPLGRRLYEHTLDRLSTRWDRFFWFGLLPVAETGSLECQPASYEGTKIIPAIEAIMIEALEPRQNRKRGDDLSAVEYIQKEDPEIQKKKIKQSVDEVFSKR